VIRMRSLAKSSCSMPSTTDHDDFARGKIEVTTQELVDERDEVRSLGLVS